MTRLLNEEGFGTEFGRWLREQPALDSRRAALSIQNLDYIVHQYRSARGSGTHHIRLIEEKRHLAQRSFAQRDTHHILDQLLREADGATVRTERGLFVNVKYDGYHVVQFEHTSPDDGAIYWNGKRIDVTTLIRRLRFDE